MVTECAWTQPGTKLFYQSECQYKDNNALPDIIDAWVRGGSLCRKYEPIAKGHLPVLAVNCDFSSRGKGEFVSFIVGHYHSDIVGSSKKYPYQNVIAFPATALDNWQNYCSDLPREIGTKSEDAITVMSIDTDGRQVRLVRVGSDFTMDMTERKYTVIKY